MIKTLIILLEHVPAYNERLRIARGCNKLPETWSEFVRYLKLRVNG